MSSGFFSEFPPAGYFLQGDLSLDLPQKSDSFTLDSPVSESPKGESPKSILKSPSGPLTPSPDSPKTIAGRVKFNETIAPKPAEPIIQDYNQRIERYKNLTEEIAAIKRILIDIVLYDNFTANNFITKQSPPSPFASFTEQMVKKVVAYCEDQLQLLQRSNSPRAQEKKSDLQMLKTVTKTLPSQLSPKLTPSDLFYILKGRLTAANNIFEEIYPKRHFEPRIYELLDCSSEVEKKLTPIITEHANYIFRVKIFSSTTGQKKLKRDSTKKLLQSGTSVQDLTLDLTQLLEKFGKYLTECMFLTWMKDAHLNAFYQHAPNIRVLSIEELFNGMPPRPSIVSSYENLKAFKDLEELSFTGNQLPSNEFIEFISTYCQQVTTLTIQFNFYAENEMPTGSFSNFSRLQSLTLCGNIPLLKEGVKALASCKALQNLQITHNNEITDEGLMGLEELCPHLKKLVFHSCSLIQAVPISNFSFNTLESAEIAHCQLVQPHIISVAGKIDTLTKLKLISNQKFTKTDFENLKPAKGLRELAIDFSFQLTDKGFRELIEIQSLSLLTMPKTGLPFEKDSLLAKGLWKKLKTREEAGNPLTIELFDHVETSQKLRVIFPYVYKNRESPGSSGDDSSEGASTGDDSDPDEGDRNHPNNRKKWSFTAGGSREV